MLILVNKDNQHLYYKELSSMHRLRKRIFKDTLGWDVKVISGMEIDQFDTDDAYYLIHLNVDGEVDACTRLIETTKPYLLADVFPELANGYIPKNEYVWESTRFCGDHTTAPKNIMGILAGGMLEMALHFGIQEYVSVSDIRIETLIKRYGWTPRRLGKTIETGTDTAAGESFVVTLETYKKLSSKCAYHKPYFIENLQEFTQQHQRKVA